MEEKIYKQPEQRKAEVLRVLAMMSDGARPADLAAEIGINEFYAAVLLSTYKRQGIILKRKCEDGRCRYLLSSKGERKLAWLEAAKGEGK